MYVKRLQLVNYGPIRDLDIRFPFDGERPKPVLLVGENGSGKTIALSHIVNAMVTAKNAIYKESNEVDAGKVFKLRSSYYVSVGREYYYAQSDFESELCVRELRLIKPKHEYVEPPMGANGRGLDAWETGFAENGVDHFTTNILEASLKAAIKQLVSERCLLYFPSNRAEEPAWLNQANLRAKPQYTEGDRIEGETPRRIIAGSPLRDVRDWLYDLAYDRAVLEIHSPSVPIPLTTPDKTKRQTFPMPVFLGYRGAATNAYNLALTVLRTITPGLAAKTNLRFGIGGRHNRIITLESGQGTVAPNLFQLSSGEMALLALFLSIVRDFDLCEAREEPFAGAQDVKGLVVVDEVDLHLHARHQYDVLPKLVHMFPNVQFVMTTHSPLFVLGMAKVFGEDGFHVYDLPSGSRASPEDFDEFGQAFRAFKTTSRFSDEVRTQVKEAQRPVLFVEGSTDKDYLRRAAELLDQIHILDEFRMQDAGGEGRLRTIWKSLTNLPEAAAKAAVLLHDPESQVDDKDEGKVCKRKMPCFEGHPISEGVENLFDKQTLEKARREKPAYIDIVFEHMETHRGEEISIPESWSVNENEKRNLCNWLCEHGSREDFRHFEGVFEILEQLECVAGPTQGSEGTSTETSSDA